MKNKIRKPLAAFGLLGILLVITGIVVFVASIYSFGVRSQQKNTLKLEGAVNTLRQISENQDAVFQNQMKKYYNYVGMICAALRSFTGNDGYEGPDIFENGIVVRVKDGQIIYPDGFHTVFSDLTPEKLNGHICESTMQSDEAPDQNSYVLVSQEIIKDTWYVYYTTLEEFYDYTNLYEKYNDFLSDTEKSYNGYMFMVYPDDPEMTFIYCSDDLGTNIKSFADVGIEREDIINRKEMIAVEPNVFDVRYINMTFMGRDVLVILMLNAENDLFPSLCNNVTAILIILIIMTAVIIWLYLVQRYVQDHVLTKDQEKDYHPHQLRKVTASIGLIAGIMIFAITFSLQLITNLYSVTKSNQGSLQIVMNRLDNIDKQTSSNQQDEEAWMLIYAEQLASLIEKKPELQTHAFLEEVSGIIDADYIMLFDENGNELISSNSFVKYKLDNLNNDDTADFSRLLMGADTIIHEPGIEKTSGRYVQMVGTRVLLDENGYGALILAMNPKSTWESLDKKEVLAFLNMVTPEGNLCTVESLADSKIKYATDTKFIGEKSDDIGLDTGTVDSSILDTFMIEGQQYYGAYDTNEDERFYYLTENRFIQMSTAPFAVSVTVCFAVIYIVISVFMLSPYHADIYEKTVIVKQQSLNGLMFDEEEDENIKELQRSKSVKRSIREQWQDVAPEKRVMAVMRIFVSVLLIVLALQLFNTSSIISFILRGNWKRGINLMAASGIILLLVFFTIFLLLKDSLTRLLVNILDPKGVTIWKLVMSLFQYIAFILFLFYAFTYLGFNTTVLLTSVSILSLAVSLGSQSLVADILAGIFLVFEDDFHVGDIIDVNGFRGRVTEIGVRSTRLIGMGDNIKIMGNQSVKNILNMSRMNSWYTMELKLSADQPLLEIEKMLEEELPKIGESIPEVISGPHYKGVWSISGGANTLSVITECREENFRRVQREVNKAIRLLFEEKGYKLG